MIHGHAQSYIITVVVNEQPKTFNVPRQDDNTLECPWKEGEGSECGKTYTSSEGLRKHLKNNHGIPSQIRIQSIGVPEVPVAAYSDDDDDGDYSYDGDSSDHDDHYSDVDEDPPRSRPIHSSVSPLEGGSVSDSAAPFVAIPRTEEDDGIQATHAPSQGNYHAGAQVASDSVGPHLYIRPSAMPHLGGGFALGPTVPLVWSAIPQMEVPSIEGGLLATHAPFSGNPAYYQAGRQVASYSIGPQRQQLHIRPSPYSRVSPSTRHFETLRAMQESPQKSRHQNIPAPQQQTFRIPGPRLSSPVPHAGKPKETPTPITPPQTTSAGSVSTNPQILATVSATLSVTAPPPPMEHDEAFRLSSPISNADFNRNDFHDPPSPVDVQAPEMASPFTNDDFAQDFSHFQDAPSPTPQATPSITKNFGRVPNPTPLVANLDVLSPVASNDNAGDGGPVGHNSFEPGANGSGAENAVANPCPCGKGMFTRSHITSNHEKSHSFRYHDRTKPIKGTLYRMELGFKFRCICDARFALIADVDAHFKEIEDEKHRGHGQSYRSADSPSYIQCTPAGYLLPAPATPPYDRLDAATNSAPDRPRLPAHAIPPSSSPTASWTPRAVIETVHCLGIVPSVQHPRIHFRASLRASSPATRRFRAMEIVACTQTHLHRFHDDAERPRQAARTLPSHPSMLRPAHRWSSTRLPPLAFLLSTQSPPYSTHAGGAHRRIADRPIALTPSGSLRSNPSVPLIHDAAAAVDDSSERALPRPATARARPSTAERRRTSYRDPPRPDATPSSPSPTAFSTSCTVIETITLVLFPSTRFARIHFSASFRSLADDGTLLCDADRMLFSNAFPPLTRRRWGPHLAARGPAIPLIDGFPGALRMIACHPTSCTIFPRDHRYRSPCMGSHFAITTLHRPHNADRCLLPDYSPVQVAATACCSLPHPHYAHPLYTTPADKTRRAPLIVCATLRSTSASPLAYVVSVTAHHRCANHGDRSPSHTLSSSLLTRGAPSHWHLTLFGKVPPETHNTRTVPHRFHPRHVHGVLPRPE
ncbi:hypothetical protein K438DRAFT_1955449 [Mycena galopus ATCC 62051]|nr:hypothetical protein K438DRAFT_1955449 [Mycena galopus ATCC 62051]